MKYYLLFFIVLILAPLPAFSQTGTIKGGVSDAVFEKGISNASVILLHPDGTAYDTVKTVVHYVDNIIIMNGKSYKGQEADPKSPADFKFEAIPADEYILRVEKIGYEPYEQRISVRYSGRGSFYDCGNIQLFKESKTLEEATVTGTRLLMVYNGDTIVYDAAALQTADGDMLANLIEKLPGAEINADGKIYVNGRYVEKLLINGKDLFNGNIEQALASLPAYTVSKIKAYENSGDRSMTTGVDMHDQEYVMDVNLKRQYRKSWIGRMDVRGGTDERYKLLLNVMRIDDRQSFAVMGSMNNINISNRLFGNYSNEQSKLEGINYERTAHVNYHLEPNKNFSFGISGGVTNHHEYNASNTATETYLTGSNTYGRSSQASKHVSTKFNASANIRYRPAKGWFMTSSYYATYYKNHMRSYSRAASYLSNPDDIFQDNVLDSTFTRPTSDVLMREYVQSRLQQANKDAAHTMTHQAFFEMQKAFGIDLLSLSGDFTHNNIVNRTFNIYNLQFPHTGAEDDYRHRYYDKSSHSASGNVQAQYIFKYAANDTVNGQLTASYRVSPGYDHSSNPLYRLDLITEEDASDNVAIDWLPSTRQALLAAIDAPNSYYRSLHSTGHVLALKWEHKFLMRNNTWMELEFDAPLQLTYNRMDYERNNTAYSVKRKGTFFNPMLQWTWYPFKDDPKGTKGYISLFYNTNGAVPLPDYLLNITDESDPLNISVGNPDLKKSRTHEVSATFNRGLKRVRMYLKGNYISYQNAIATQYTYNQQTGISHALPVNVSGNWQMSISNGYTIFFDKAQKWYMTYATEWSYRNSRDMNTWDNATVEDGMQTSAFNVRTMMLRPELRVNFNDHKVLDCEFYASAVWQNITGERADFTRINAWEINYVFTAQSKLPWEIELRTRINATSRFGYSDASLNDTRIIWSAKITRQFKHGVSLMAEANDLLHQNKSITTTINSQGRTERYAQTLPAYFMFGVSWNFTKLQGTKKKN